MTKVRSVVIKVILSLHDHGLPNQGMWSEWHLMTILNKGPKEPHRADSTVLLSVIVG